MTAMKDLDGCRDGSPVFTLAGARRSNGISGNTAAGANAAEVAQRHEVRPALLAAAR
jgi:hypothetical protein